MAAREVRIRQGIENPIHARGYQVARRQGADERQHQVGTFSHAAPAQGHAEIIVVIGDAQRAGDVDQPALAKGGVEHDAR